MELIRWDEVNVEMLAEELIDKFKEFPWEYYDGVSDSHPNEITPLDCAISVFMESNFTHSSKMRDWHELSQKIKPDVDILLYKYDCTLSLEEDTPHIGLFCEDLKSLFKKLINVKNWRVAKLTKVLHRKRPKLIPMIDSVVRMAYCFGPRSSLWNDENNKKKDISIEHSIAALHGLREELIQNLDSVKRIIGLAHGKAPSIIPETISNLRCLESLIHWQNRRR